MAELRQSLEVMGAVQWLLAASFLACYTLAVGGFFGPGSRGPAALISLVSAVAFSVKMENWVHGFLLTALAIIGIAVFIVAAWILQKSFSGQRPIRIFLGRHARAPASSRGRCRPWSRAVVGFQPRKLATAVRHREHPRLISVLPTCGMPPAGEGADSARYQKVRSALAFVGTVAHG